MSSHTRRLLRSGRIRTCGRCCSSDVTACTTAANCVAQPRQATADGGGAARAVGRCRSATPTSDVACTHATLTVGSEGGLYPRRCCVHLWWCRGGSTSGLMATERSLQARCCRVRVCACRGGSTSSLMATECSLQARCRRCMTAGGRPSRSFSLLRGGRRRRRRGRGCRGRSYGR